MAVVVVTGFAGSGAGAQPAVALVHAAAGTTNATDVQSKLIGTGLFSQVALISAEASTPTLATLQQYSAVMVWSNNSFANSTALGDVMADYIDAGGGVVISVFANTDTLASRFLGGRWDASYQIVPSAGGTTSGGSPQTLGTVSIPGHPLFQGVNTLSGGTSCWRPTTATLTAHGVLVAQWSGGKTLAAVSSTRPRRVDLGMYPPSTTVNSTGWDPTTDGARLMANALLYAGRTLCYANCDSSTTAPVVNTGDFTCFLQQYSAAVQLPAAQQQPHYANCDGSTTFPMVNTGDFTCFLQKYAAGCT
jgi:hypothetical protein